MHGFRLLGLFSQIPTRATPQSAGFDLYTIENGVIEPWNRALVATGVAVQLPEGTYGRIAPRSGLAWKNGIHIGAGVIDSDYTGELKVVMFNMSSEPYTYSIGDRIAQFIIEKYDDTPMPEIDTLQHTANIRGSGGFGSTGN